VQRVYSPLHSALIHDEMIVANALIERCEQMGVLNNVISMRNHMQQVTRVLQSDKLSVV